MRGIAQPNDGGSIIDHDTNDIALNPKPKKGVHVFRDFIDL